jgi:hypothetical protein
MEGSRVLDVLKLSKETKGAAEATYMKKRMYYNMKIKTLQRKTSDGVKLALEGKVAQIGRAQVSVSALCLGFDTMFDEFDGKGELISEYKEKRRGAQTKSCKFPVLSEHSETTWLDICWKNMSRAAVASCCLHI